MFPAQVMVHKDSIDSSAFFLYRKIPAKPLEPAVLLPGPPVEASDEQMSVRDLLTKCVYLAANCPVHEASYPNVHMPVILSTCSV